MMWKSFVEISDAESESGTIIAERIGVDFENSPLPGAIPIRLESDSATAETTLSNAEPLAPGRWFLQPIIPWIVSSWLLGVAMLSLRLLISWWSVQRLRRRASQPANENWQVLLRRMCEQLRVTQSVKLVESALVEVPAVIGWLRPVILLPATAMTGLTTEQLEALLAHELAHVRRHDYLINLIQTLVETLLFYHPAVWWISHRIRVEREHCCDDLAVQVCGNGIEYAKALVAMEELRAPSLGIAMSACGGSLLSRVTRLHAPAVEQRRPIGWIAGLFALLLLSVAGVLGAGLLTPPEKPTAGLPNGAATAETKSTDEKKTDETTEARETAKFREKLRERIAEQNSVRGRLQTPLALHFENAKLREVVEHIARGAKITVRWDSESLEKSGFEVDLPVSINVDGISTASALQLLLEPMQVGYLIENETLLVTSAERIAKTPVDEQLNLGKILADGTQMGLLRDAIQTFVEPKEWDIAGGSGSNLFSVDREEFIVRHVPRVHQEVASFLRHFQPMRKSAELQRLRKLLTQRFTLKLGDVTLRDALHKIGSIGHWHGCLNG